MTALTVSDSLRRVSPGGVVGEGERETEMVTETDRDGDRDRQRLTETDRDDDRQRDRQRWR